jgi:molybdate transport system substrate-binding protein
VPLEAYPTMEQGGLILDWARDPAAARAFRDFLLGPQGRAILERYGFELPWTGKPSG